MAVSVVDRWTARLERAAEALGLPLTVATADRIPLLTALPRPDLTGPDRLLAAWTASVLHGQPVIVVDLGTATTVDAVDADGFFLGGAILPGLGLAAARPGRRHGPLAARGAGPARRRHRRGHRRGAPERHRHRPPGRRP